MIRRPAYPGWIQILRTAAICLVFAAVAAPGWTEVTLLSDRVIEKISAGAGDTVKAWIEEGRYGLLSGHYYSTDADGTPGAPHPGSIMVSLPHNNFQSSGIALNPALYPDYPPELELYPVHPALYPDGLYDDFEYRFSSQADADRFQSQLEANGQTNIRRRIIYTNSSADTIGLDDGTAARVAEVIVVTEKEVSPTIVGRFNGTVVEEPILFGLHFPVTGKTTASIVPHGGEEKIPWTGVTHQYNKTGWPIVGYQDFGYLHEHRYGKLLELGSSQTGGQPIREPITGNILVPADTAFIKSTMVPLELYSPEVALSLSLVAASDQLDPDCPGCASCQKLLPDCTRMPCTLGLLAIHSLNIKFSGTSSDGEFGEIDDGNGIYIYPLED